MIHHNGENGYGPRGPLTEGHFLDVAAEFAVLGIDLGTSQVKALLCGGDGRVLGQGAAGYPLRTPRAGWAEADPGDWWRATGAAVRAAVGPAYGDSGGATEIAGLAVVGQMHGVVLTDAAGTALRPAVTWLDRRAAAEAGEYARLPRRLLAALGSRPSPGMAGPIAAWLARHEPDVFGRARWLLQPKDWLRMRLTGEPASDPTDASGTLLFDMTRGQWAAEIAEAMGLDPRLLPPPRPSSDIAGKLSPEAAAHLGLRPGLPVAIGAADTAASLLAAGLPAAGWAMLTLGTGGQWVVPAAVGAAGDPNGKTSLYCRADGGAYRLAAAQNVGVALDWVTSVLGTSWADLYNTAARPWTPDSPLFRPSLASERWDDPAGGPGGAWDGLSLAHGRDDLLRAALEGVAFLLRSSLDDLRRADGRAERVVIAGGGSRDPAWRQLLADVFGVPLFAAGSTSLSARGATLIAGMAAGVYESWGEAARSLPPPEPAAEPANTQAAAEHYRRWLAALT
jgi:xylulokinase